MTEINPWKELSKLEESFEQIDTQDIILPDGVKYIRHIAPNECLLVHETRPGIYDISRNMRSDLGVDTFQVSFPYMFVVIEAIRYKGLFHRGRHWPQIYFSHEPLRSSLEVDVYIPPLLNVNNPELAKQWDGAPYMVGFGKVDSYASVIRPHTCGVCLSGNAKAGGFPLGVFVKNIVNDVFVARFSANDFIRQLPIQASVLYDYSIWALHSKHDPKFIFDPEQCHLQKLPKKFFYYLAKQKTLRVMEVLQT